MLTVITLCTGDKYAEVYVDKLQAAVARHLTQPYEFVCVRETELPGWWGKLELFKRTGPHLWLDLDVVITGSLDGFCQTGQAIRCGLNWAQSGHGGCQSSVMYWEHAPQVYDLFDHTRAHWPPVNGRGMLWGDQEWLTVLRDTGQLAVDYFDPTQLISYKYHCRNGLPKAARVVAFHGKPDPHEVTDDWVKQCW